MINYLINANPKGPWVADCDGYLPLHWAVNQDQPNIGELSWLFCCVLFVCVLVLLSFSGYQHHESISRVRVFFFSSLTILFYFSAYRRRGLSDRGKPVRQRQGLSEGLPPSALVRQQRRSQHASRESTTAGALRSVPCWFIFDDKRSDLFLYLLVRFFDLLLCVHSVSLAVSW